VLIDLLSRALFLPRIDGPHRRLVEISCLVSTAPGYAIEAVKIPLLGSVAGFASDVSASVAGADRRRHDHISPNCGSE
jgi:hypothetical protein